MGTDLRDELSAMAEEDQRVRAELAADGSLFDGYHPRTRFSAAGPCLLARASRLERDDGR